MKNTVSKMTHLLALVALLSAMPAFATPAAGGAHSAGQAADALFSDAIEMEMPDDAHALTIDRLSYENAVVGYREVSHDCSYDGDDGCMPTTVENVYAPRIVLHVEFKSKVGASCAWDDTDTCPYGNPPRLEVVLDPGYLPSSIEQKLQNDTSLSNLEANRAFAASLLDMSIERKNIDVQVIDYQNSKTCVDSWSDDNTYIPGCKPEYVYKTIPQTKTYLIVKRK